MKEYRRKELAKRIEKEEGILEVMKKGLTFEGRKPYQIAALTAKIEKQLSVINFMKAAYEKGAAI